VCVLSLCLLISADPCFVSTLQCSLREHGLRGAGASSLVLATIHGRGYALRLRDDAVRQAAR
jgi:hypothetical protein